jgi:hypothetical protein
MHNLNLLREDKPSRNNSRGQIGFYKSSSNKGSGSPYREKSTCRIETTF